MRLRSHPKAVFTTMTVHATPVVTYRRMNGDSVQGATGSVRTAHV
jgi:hypothetical protein